MLVESGLTPGQIRDQQESLTAIQERFQGIRPGGANIQKCKKVESNILRLGKDKIVKIGAKKIIEKALTLIGKTEKEIATFINVSREQLTANLEDLITAYFLKIGAPKEKIARFLGRTPETASLRLRKNVETLAKMLEHLPSAEEYAYFASLPIGCGCGKECPECKRVNFKNLKKVKHPLLYNYSIEEIHEAIQPWIRKHSVSYCSNRYDSEIASSDGFIGLLNTLRTDAGISPFASHSFRHTRTNIRRSSAQSSVIKGAENRPSKTEIRTIITLWLQGKIEEKEECSGYAKAGVIINNKSLIASNDLEECLIQKTGIKDAKALLVKNSVRLDKFGLATVTDLFSYLKLKFGYMHLVGHKKKKWGTDLVKIDSHRLPTIIYFDQFKTIADLVNCIAVNPDFHGNPMTIETDDDDENPSVGVSMMAECPMESEQESLSLLEHVKNKVALTPNQALVQNKSFGLDGEEPVPAHVLAKFFRLYTGEAQTCSCGGKGCLKCEEMGVSKERIAQNQRTVIRKWREAIWQEIENAPNFYKMMRMACKMIPLTNAERNIFNKYYGVNELKLYEIEELVPMFEELTGQPTSPEAEKCIREMLHEAQLKIMREIY